MRRYSRLLVDSYRDRGWTVLEVAPKATFSSHLSQPLARKIAKYIEVMLAFPIVLLMSPRSDLIHLADHSNAMWLLFVRRSATITTCHDLIALKVALGEIPEHKSSILGRAFQRLMLIGLKRSSLIIAVSKDTERDVNRLVGGVRTVCLPNPVIPPLGESRPLPLEKRHRFALIVASSGWRKRRDRGIQYWALLRMQRGFEDLRLVAVGPPLSQDELNSAGNYLERIEVLTGVADEELAELYRTANVLIHPSEYEGFGWPIIEANVYGTPVIANDIPVSREVGSSYNIFVANPPFLSDWGLVAQAISCFPVQAIADHVKDEYGVLRFEERLASVASSIVGISS